MAPCHAYRGAGFRDGLTDERQAAFRDAFHRRLQGLPAAAFGFRRPVVAALAERPQATRSRVTPSPRQGRPRTGRPGSG